MADNRTLAARIRAREKQVEAGGHVFTIRRPKPADMVSSMTRMDLVRRFTVGWNLKNADLMPGGTPDQEPFDAALFADFVEDAPALWGPLTDAILAEWNAYLAAQEAAEKN